VCRQIDQQQLSFNVGFFNTKVGCVLVQVQAGAFCVSLLVKVVALLLGGTAASSSSKMQLATSCQQAIQCLFTARGVWSALLCCAVAA
jgi:hypothetical protein